MKPPSRLLPHLPHQRLSHNPLFAYEVRRVRWGGSGDVMVKSSRRWLTIVCAILLLLWGVLLASSPYQWEVASYNFAVFLLGLSLLGTLILDYRAVSSAVGSVNGDVIAGRWDLLRLTPLRDDQLIIAKHGTAQVRAWRWMMLMIAVRLAVSLMTILSSVYVILRDRPYSYTTLGQDLVSLLVIVSLCVILVVEPFWRMRAVTALGVAISARARQQTSAVLAAIGVVAGMWLMQGVILIALGAIITFLAAPLGFLELSSIQIVICTPLFLVGVFISTVYGFYSILQTWSLRRAVRWIARSD